MKTFPIFVYIILLINLSFGVVIKGTVTNSTTSAPVDSALITFRAGLPGSPHPTTYTDSRGYFQIELTRTPQFPLQIAIKRDGFLLKKFEIKITTDLIDLGNITMVEVSYDTILFWGTVIDSMTRNPITGIKIKLDVYKLFNNNYPLIEINTDSSGSFNQLVILSNDYRVGYTISKDGYYSKSSAIISEMDSVHQKIMFSPEGTIRTEVTGLVIDSITRQPVNNALVELWTHYSESCTFKKPDTSYTNSSGTFTRSIERVITIGSSMMPSVICKISHYNYNSKLIRKRLGIVPPKIDLGETVILSKNNLRKTTLIPQIKIKIPESTPRFTVFSLNGRTISKDIINHKQLDAASQIFFFVEDKDKSPGTGSINLIQRDLHFLPQE